jgi:predicted transcriptional regulator
MVDLIDRAAEKEHRTRSELVRQALRLYLRGIPVEPPTLDEVAAMKRGNAEARAGEVVTLDHLRNELAPRRRQVRRQRA